MIEIKGLKELADKLSKSATHMRNFRLDFYNWFKRQKVDLGEILKKEGRDYIENQGWIDTGTFHKRMDYDLTDQWNSLAYGVFESDSEYYDSSRHAPTSNVSRYTNRTIPPNKKYAEYVIDNDPFLTEMKSRIVEEWVEERINYYKKMRFQPF